MSGISLTGLASGLDTTKMIQQLMELERIPYKKLETKKSTLTQNQSIIRALNTKLNTLKNAAADLMYSTAFNQKTASASDSSMVKVTASESAVTGSYELVIDKLAKKHAVSSGAFDADAKVFDAISDFADALEEVTENGETTYTLKFTLGGKDIEVSGIDGDTTVEELLNQLKDKMNAAKAGVTASLLETSPGKLTLVLTADDYGTKMQVEGADPGDFTAIDFGGNTGVLEKLGIVSVVNGEYQVNERQAAQLAVVNVNGIEVNVAGNTLNNVIQGLTIDLQKTGSVTVTVARDVNKVADKIQAFVNAYNDVVDHIRTNTAGGAPLRGDSTLRMLQQELHNLLNNFLGRNLQGKNADFEGNLHLLSDIGLEIDKGVTSGSNMTGKITFDRNKFHEVFNEDPDSVYHLFAYDGEGSANDGVAVRFFKGLSDWTRTGSGYLAFKLTGYDEDIKFITEQMENMERILESRQRKLESQFAAMESALMSLRNEQTWLTNQIASMMLQS